MRSVSVSWAKNNLSAVLREVRAGAAITITDRGLPVARLVPPGPTRGISPAAIELAQRGLLVLPEHEATANWAKGVARPRLKKGASAVAGLLAERESGW